MNKSIKFELNIFLIVVFAFVLPMNVCAQETSVSSEPEAVVDDSLGSEQPSYEDPKGESHYIYDLKNLIKRSRRNIERVNDKIREQAVYKRNLMREDKAREYYEQGLKLEAEGKLDEARVFYDKAVRISEHPEMKGYIRESEKRFKVQAAAIQREEHDQIRRVNEENRLKLQEAQRVYDSAVSLFKQEKFHEAQEDFQFVEAMVPDFKATRSYIKITAQEIFEQDAMAAKLQKEELVRQQKEAELARTREKELWRKEIERKEKERSQHIKQQAEEIYEEAIKFYKEKKWLDAKEKFQEVEWVVPNYKGVRKYIARIEDAIKEETSRLAEQKEKELERQRWEAELAKRKEEEARRQKLEQDEQEKLARLREEANFVYTGAVKLYKQEKKDDALTQFLEVERIYPDYKATRKYIQRLDVEKAREIHEKELAFAEKKQKEELAKLAELDKQDKDLKTIEKAKIHKKSNEDNKETGTSATLAKSDVKEIYNTAVLFFKNRKYEESLEKFKLVQQTEPGYRATEKYIERIAKKLEIEVPQIAAEIDSQEKLKEIDSIKEPKMSDLEKRQARKELREEVYQKTKDMTKPQHSVDLAVTVQKGKNDPVIHEEGFLGGAGLQSTLEMVKEDSVDPKKTAYLERLEREKEAQMLKNLAQEATSIFAQIKALSSDVQEVSESKSFEEVEKIFENLVDEQERLMVRVQKEKDEELRKKRIEEEKEERIRQKKLDREQREREKELKEKADDLYKEAIAAYKEKRFTDAKQLFSQLNKIKKGYRDIEKYWNSIDDLIIEEKILQAEYGDKQKIEELASRAAVINQEIIALTEQRKFEDIKVQFDELKQILLGIKNIKEVMVSRRGTWKHNRNVQDAYKEKQKSLEEKKKLLAEEKLKAEQKRKDEYNRVEMEKKRKDEVTAKDKAEAAVEYEKEKTQFDRSLARENLAIIQQRVNERSSKEEKLAKIRLQQRKYLKNTVDEKDFSYEIKDEYSPDLEPASKREIELEKQRIEQEQREKEEIKKKQEQEALRQKQIVEEQALYEEAMQLYKSEQYNAAKEKFSEYQSVATEPKDIRRYMSKIDRVLEKEQLEVDRQKKLETRKVLKTESAQEVLIKDVPVGRDEKLKKEEAIRLRQERLAEKQQRKEKVAQQRALRKLEQKNRYEREKLEQKRQQRENELLRERMRAEKKYDSKEHQKNYEKYKAYAKETDPSYNYAEQLDYIRSEKEDINKIEIERYQNLLESRRKNVDEKIINEQKDIEDKAGFVFHELKAKQQRDEDVYEDRLVRERQILEFREARKGMEGKVEVKDPKVEAVVLKGSEEEIRLPVSDAVKIVDPLEQARLEAMQRREELKRRQQELRKQFEKGVEDMYIEAIRLRKQKDYKRALGKFNEIERLSPGYKKSGRYIEHLEKIIEKRQRKANRLSEEYQKESLSEDPSYNPNTWSEWSSGEVSADEKSKNQEDVVGNMLDLFDPNVQ